jgi:hypothetical protein
MRLPQRTGRYRICQWRRHNECCLRGLRCDTHGVSYGLIPGGTPFGNYYRTNDCVKGHNKMDWTGKDRSINLMEGITFEHKGLGICSERLLESEVPCSLPLGRMVELSGAARHVL